ncbi:MAG: hypothetical protein M9962_15015 [Oligoflexia bacterium]|nr:hypothetical protein [Oligoflexia bacterium]
MDLTTKEILKIISKKVRDFLVVGAVARDEICERYNIPLGAATEDLDIAVVVEDEAEFNKVKDSLISTGFLETESKIRLKYEDRKIDLVPFGAIAVKDIVILKGDKNRPLNVSGFIESLEAALKIQIESDLEISIPSPEFYIYLKLRCYEDRKLQKDVADFWLMLQHKKLIYPNVEYDSSAEYFELVGDRKDVQFEDFLFYFFGKHLRDVWGEALASHVGLYLLSELKKEPSLFASHLRGLEGKDPINFMLYVAAGLNRDSFPDLQ